MSQSTANRPPTASAAAAIEVPPMDAHNRALVANVHPPGWVQPEPRDRYHLVVIGAGTAGLVAAAGAAGLGARVALIERHLMGGDCLNVGCVPSKCLIRSARAAHDVRDAARFGVAVPEGVGVDFSKAMERLRRIRAGISPHDSACRFHEMGVDVFLGDGRFIGPDRIEVAGRALRFRKAVIATGARAATLPIPGLAEAGFLTNETVFSLTERPRRLAVIGGGPIGCELAQSFRRLGCGVTLFHDRSHVLDREDADAAAIVEQRFIDEGIRLVLDARIARVALEPGGKALYHLAGGREERVEADEILLAAGRAPNVDGLGLEAAGIAYEKSGVTVDDRLRTTNRRVFAAGDVCMQWKFTHAADFAARIVIQNALFLGRKRASALTMPWCTYTDPEVAHVGLYESEAAARGIATDTFIRHLADVDRARADGDEAGFVKVLVRKGGDRILGATIVARHAGEMIGELALAITNRVGLKGIGATIHLYPTQAEAIRQIGDQWARTRLTPFARRVLGWWWRMWE